MSLPHPLSFPQTLETPPPPFLVPDSEPCLSIAAIMSSDPLEKEFQQFKKDSTIHGLLMGLSFLVILPAGTLIARYLRTFTRR